MCFFYDFSDFVMCECSDLWNIGSISSCDRYVVQHFKTSQIFCICYVKRFSLIVFTFESSLVMRTRVVTVVGKLLTVPWCDWLLSTPTCFDCNRSAGCYTSPLHQSAIQGINISEISSSENEMNTVETINLLTN